MSAFTISLQEASEVYGNDMAAYGLDTFPTPATTDTAAMEFRNALGRKIVDHYWNREIGLESYSMWRFNIRRKMNEIMPYYVKLYKSEALVASPLSTMDMLTTSKNDQSGTSAGKSDNAGSSTATSKSAASSFPQTMLDDNDTGNYAESGQDSVGTGTNSATATDSRSDTAKGTSETRTTGYAGNVSDLLNAYRATLLNIDMNVIRDLEDLFMQTLDPGDNWTNGNGYIA